MKLQFTHKAYQAAAVDAVTECFAGQPKNEGLSYRIDPGKQSDDQGHQLMDYGEEGFRNSKLALSPQQILNNIHAVQKGQNLPLSTKLVATKNCDVNLDVEMETGTGKTYCYIKTMFEMNRRYGWNKFIIVVPSIAIREGVYTSLDITAEHFLQDYGKRTQHFIYDSKQLHNLEGFSSGSAINVMVINVQAFHARGKDARRIYEELDDFNSRRPIDVIKANRPILILDEPQKMEGAKTQESLKEFNPLFVLRYSATHKNTHNKIHRLDALDAYNQKLVKKISVRGITMKGLSGTNSYLFLESIQVSAKQAPIARMEVEIRTKSGVKRVIRKISLNDNLQELSGGLNQYDGYVVADIDAIRDVVIFSNGVEIETGMAIGNVNEAALRRIQIRETIRAHFEKERHLFHQGIKVLSLFFIDEVAKYRQYDEDGEQALGEYAKIFEEEYNDQLNEILELDDSPYQNYLKGIDADKTHNGYFSIDKKGKLADPKVKTRGEDAGTTDDVSAYDLILKDKERLLSFKEPTRFIFSHSALREGWDNPNVFVICTLKHSDNTVSRRQEVGRGMRLCVNQQGERMDNPIIAHQINVLTVVANESYQDFVKGLQSDISKSLSQRPQKADTKYFTGKVLKTSTGDIEVTPTMAKQIERYLIKNDYTDDDDKITEAYHTAKKEELLAALPEDLAPHAEQIFTLIDSVFSEASMPEIDNDRNAKVNPLNNNFHKKEFQALWQKINQKAAYTVHFDSAELIKKSIPVLDKNLKVTPLQFTITSGEQEDELDFDDVKHGDAFKIKENSTQYHTRSAHSGVRYDLIGDIAGNTQLTRRTITAILRGINKAVFNEYKRNPEEFIHKASTLIKEQKATAVIEHLSYDPIEDRHDVDIFTKEQTKDNFSNAFKADNHVYDYVVTDSKNERKFVENLDTSTEVTVYAKLPRGFAIPTPVGDYNPDWAIVFQEGKVKHIYFIAETKGSMSSLQLRPIEEIKIECARKFFTKITSEKVKYDVVDSYEELMKVVV